MDKAERMERSARFCFIAGTVVGLVSLASLLPPGYVVEYANAFVGALIEAFMDSPSSAY